MGVIRFAKASSLYYVISINLFILPSDLQRAWVERGREGKSYVYVSLRQKHFAFFSSFPSVFLLHHLVGLWHMKLILIENV